MGICCGPGPGQRRQNCARREVQSGYSYHVVKSCNDGLFNRDGRSTFSGVCGLSQSDHTWDSVSLPISVLCSSSVLCLGLQRLVCYRILSADLRPCLGFYYFFYYFFFFPHFSLSLSPRRGILRTLEIQDPPIEKQN